MGSCKVETKNERNPKFPVEKPNLIPLGSMEVKTHFIAKKFVGNKYQMLKDEYSLEERIKYDDEISEQLERMKIQCAKDDDEFNSFLAKVNEVETIIKGLSSKDEKTVEKAAIKAELLVHDLDSTKNNDENNCTWKETINRTVINQAAFDSFYNNNEPEQMDQRIFMKTVEADAKKRAEDRRQRKEIAERHKQEGNQAFRSNDYVKALACFNRAIAASKDSALLFNNRSLTCLKLGLYNRALEDAKAALLRNEKSVKAFIYQAEALYNLGRFDESKETIKKACKEVPESCKLFKEAESKWLSESVQK